MASTVSWRLPAVRSDPGRDELEGKLMVLTPQERWRISGELREKGFALVWDQLERAGPMGPVEQVMFLIDRLYPEMPAAHRATFQRKFQAEFDAGRWHGPVRRAATSRADVGPGDTTGAAVP